MSVRSDFVSEPTYATVHVKWTRRASAARSLSASVERAILLLPLLVLLLVVFDHSRPAQLHAATARGSNAVHAVRLLRVCADPNNLPFSNERREGFENKLADLVASEMGATVQYEWWAQRRGFFRNTLKAGRCDVVMGVPTSFEMTLTTPSCPVAASMPGEVKTAVAGVAGGTPFPRRRTLHREVEQHPCHGALR